MKQAKPWGYWRCEDYKVRRPGARPYVLNEMGSYSNAYRTENDAPLVTSSPGNKVAFLTDDTAWHGFFTNIPKGVLPQVRNFSVEVWFCPGKFRYHSLASITHDNLIKPEEDPIQLSNLHVFLAPLMRDRQWADQDRLFRVRYNVFKDGKLVSSHFCKSNVVYMPNQWYHVVVTKSDNELSLYVNGKLESSTPLPNTEDADPMGNWVNFGFVPHQSNVWRSAAGALDEFAFYSRALGADEVENHYHIVRSANEVKGVGGMK